MPSCFSSEKDSLEHSGTRQDEWRRRWAPLEQLDDQRDDRWCRLFIYTVGVCPGILLTSGEIQSVTALSSSRVPCLGKGLSGLPDYVPNHIPSHPSNSSVEALTLTNFSA